MSKLKEEAKYFERLDIAIVSIDKMKDIVKNNIKNTLSCWDNGKNIEKMTYHIISSAGVGKTSSCYQIANELSEELKKNFNVIMIKSPVISRDDLLCPFPEIDGEKKKFKMYYSDFIPIEKDSYGLFVIDEFSRGDNNLQQLMWQVINEYKIHLQDFPKGWFVISLDNPEEAEYSMNYIEDAAGLRRMVHIYVEVSPKAFITYAIQNGFHSYIVEFIQTHPEYLYDFDSQKVGRVYANPASWEKVSNILWGYEISGKGIIENLYEIEVSIAGLLNMTMTRLFLDFIKNKGEDIKPSDIFFNYEKVRPKILKLVKDGKNLKIGQAMTSVMTYLSTSMPVFNDNNLENITNFMLDIPADIGATYFSWLSDLKKKDQKAFIYMSKIQVDMIKDDNYRTRFYDVMVDMSKRSRE